MRRAGALPIVVRESIMSVRSTSSVCEVSRLSPARAG
jgi:hypothetical protein